MATKKDKKSEVPTKEEKKVKVKGKNRSGSTALKVVGGAIAGAAVGALAGVLLAPDSGKKTRKLIADKSKQKATEVKNKVASKVKKLTAKASHKS
ncbi:MAG TPA: YtxH domain-containing protein [Cyclobacteriaceae bacterium]